MERLLPSVDLSGSSGAVKTPKQIMGFLTGAYPHLLLAVNHDNFLKELVDDVASPPLRSSLRAFLQDILSSVSFQQKEYTAGPTLDVWSGQFVRCLRGKLNVQVEAVATGIAPKPATFFVSQHKEAKKLWCSP